jgi:fructose-bisphosphate aldolase class II
MGLMQELNLKPGVIYGDDVLNVSFFSPSAFAGRCRVRRPPLPRIQTADRFVLVHQLFTYAKKKGFAIPAVNVTSSSTVYAHLLPPKLFELQ